MNKQLVSVIIPSRKGENIKPVVDSVKASTYKHIEIIPVCLGLERSAQRNAGIDAANGKYYLFLDSDQPISSTLIEECVSLIKHHSGIYIPEVITTKGIFSKIRNWERQFYTGTAVDVVRFVRASCCPKFDETMSGPEDSDWDRRVNGLRTISKSCLYHQDNVGVVSYFKKKAYYTKSMKRFTEKWPRDEVLSFRYRCWTVFVENGKWKRLIKAPHMTLAVAGILLIRGIIFLSCR
jgi:glycosyltransferase involved in cell wall biosynthesis